MTKEEIAELNAEFLKKYNTYDQGVYVEPYGIPTNIKEPVVYMRWSPGGVSGGSCWDSSNPQDYTNDDKPEFLILDFILKKLKPNITYLDYKELDKLVKKSSETQWEYYGNCTKWDITFIELSKLEKFLNHLD